uniref:Dimer_Tnp_hAT domain-containing protein n=1 Tax=Strongyloides papillosus TaxID=174720 RepID=A0A0N5BJR7_STREA
MECFKLMHHIYTYCVSIGRRDKVNSYLKQHTGKGIILVPKIRWIYAYRMIHRFNQLSSQLKGFGDFYFDNEDINVAKETESLLNVLYITSENMQNNSFGMKDAVFVLSELDFLVKKLQIRDQFKNAYFETAKKRLSDVLDISKNPIFYISAFFNPNVDKILCLTSSEKEIVINVLQKKFNLNNGIEAVDNNDEHKSNYISELRKNNNKNINSVIFSNPYFQTQPYFEFGNINLQKYYKAIITTPASIARVVGTFSHSKMLLDGRKSRTSMETVKMKLFINFSLNNI